MSVNVLAVLDKTAKFWEDSVEAFPGYLATVGNARAELEQARAAIAELIAADLELDAAKRDLCLSPPTSGTAFCAAVARVHAAEERRAAALAAVTGEVSDA